MALIVEFFLLWRDEQVTGFSALISDSLKEWQDKETLHLTDMTEEWTEYMYGEANSPAL